MIKTPNDYGELQNALKLSIRLIKADPPKDFPQIK